MIWKVVLKHNDWWEIRFDFTSWVEAGVFAQKMLEHFSGGNSDEDDKITVHIDLVKVDVENVNIDEMKGDN